ncbi:MAG: hypothetical protein UY26_C0002G0099 [Candidatus Jorgensenbacteria bacterium GW2011_GWA1_48_13]|uniref:Uncharacterized protein n=2 Tax=Candidatus Joergenseniibacteriota TaxID=1752739 RepID=A0A0G1YK69_9BACT|nr:MAG: hypothetical protein UY26_C0002G0099 [Candidatus Jorgensenbacteria bacterium GW2011_GWA1_48_13]KKU99217.1 MAG: hypothetical protein UY32_C0004G0009 [Candidatus Jorgensenbacteria bacterium GW2011_GWC1_48_8]KKW15412.1 MAG: hypothetical protein UY55_C0001G0166 [Candidatus Jorgensenbacteria bacterium GW2011_GWB1_50_10]
MFILFLTLEGLIAHANEHPEREWLECSLFFLDCEPGKLKEHQRLDEAIRYLERRGRVSWRREVNPFANHDLLNQLLKSSLLRPFNAGLAARDDPEFLREAVLAANNGNHRVEVVV